jgi:hypothetical protein
MVKKLCKKCEKEYELSKKEKIQREITVKLLKSISSALPTLAITLEEAKDCCFECFRAAILKDVGPMAATLFGQQTSESQAAMHEQLKETSS